MSFTSVEMLQIKMANLVAEVVAYFNRYQGSSSLDSKADLQNMLKRLKECDTAQFYFHSSTFIRHFIQIKSS